MLFVFLTAIALIISHVVLFPKTKGILRSLKSPVKK